MGSKPATVNKSSSKPSTVHKPGSKREPHRGGLILTFGILSVSFLTLFWCFIPAPVALGFGIVAWWMGQIDRRKFRDKSMHPGGESITRAGWICGIIGTVLNAIVVLVYGPLLASTWYDNIQRSKQIKRQQSPAQPSEPIAKVEPKDSNKPPIDPALQPVVVATWALRANNGPPRNHHLYSNGRIGSPNSPNTWDLKRNAVIFRWPNPQAPRGVWVDVCTLSADRNSCRGKNQRGVPVSGEKISGADWIPEQRKVQESCPCDRSGWSAGTLPALGGQWLDRLEVSGSADSAAPSGT